MVVGQAAHWFDLDRFYPQVQRVLRPGGLALLVGYNLVQFDDPKINAYVQHLYENVLGDYWDPERRSPLDEDFLAELAALWPDGALKPIQFPIFGRAGFFSMLVPL